VLRAAVAVLLHLVHPIISDILKRFFGGLVANDQNRVSLLVIGVGDRPELLLAGGIPLEG